MGLKTRQCCQSNHGKIEKVKAPFLHVKAKKGFASHSTNIFWQDVEVTEIAEVLDELYDRLQILHMRERRR